MESSTERCFQMFRDYFGLAAVVAGFHAGERITKGNEKSEVTLRARTEIFA